ncbi:MAG: hypothetical protein LUD72_10005 [Bacteroidales bacterium]|nr:hypothetical protein [Bacteroidales bacterium]
MDIMTLEEFTEEVKEVFATERFLSQEKIDAYFETDEVKRQVRSKYNVSMKDLETEKITEKMFRIGRTGSIAHCLALMY